MPNKPEYALNIEGIVASKGGHLPKYVLRILDRLLHLKTLNPFLVQGYEGVEFCTRALEYLDIKLEVEGLENVPCDGSLYTFVSNHPLGGIDGVAMGSVVGTNFGSNIRYLVNDVLMNIKGLAPICVPVNKMGGQSRNLPVQINEAFHSDNHMIMFPAGLCSRKTKGEIKDLPWGKAFVTRSIETRRSVVPVHFIARNSDRFYRIANICKFLRIKFNVAMLFLPDEMMKARHSTFRMVFGKPIPYTFFDASGTPLQWAEYVKEEVYKL